MSFGVEDEEVEDGRKRQVFCLAWLTKRSTLVVEGDEVVDDFRLLFE